MRNRFRVVLPVLVPVVTFLLTAVAGGAFAAEAPFVPFDLGTIGGSESLAYAVNTSGQVVGRGHIAGDSTSHAFSWTPKGGMIDLGTLGGTSSLAKAVNDSGQVVGESYIAGSGIHVFSWTLPGGMIDLGTLGGCCSWAEAINASGQVVGVSSRAGNDANHAFSWTPTGGMIDLGTLGGRDSGFEGVFFEGVPVQALNASGHTVGVSETVDDRRVPFHAFSWTPTGGMIDLGTLGGILSVALAVNDGGHVVGYSVTAIPSSGCCASTHAFLWTEEGG